MPQQTTYTFKTNEKVETVCKEIKDIKNCMDNLELKKKKKTSVVGLTSKWRGQRKE